MPTGKFIALNAALHKRKHLKVPITTTTKRQHKLKANTRKKIVKTAEISEIEKRKLGPGQCGSVECCPVHQKVTSSIQGTCPGSGSVPTRGHAGGS